MLRLICTRLVALTACRILQGGADTLNGVGPEFDFYFATQLPP